MDIVARVVAAIVAIMVVFIQAPCAWFGYRALDQKRYRTLTLILAVDTGGSFALVYGASLLIL